MRSLLAGRRRLAAAGIVGVALVTVIIVLVGGSGQEGRPYPEPGDVEEVTSREALDVSFIRDFAIGSDDTMYLAVGKDDDPRAVISISAKGVPAPQWCGPETAKVVSAPPGRWRSDGMTCSMSPTKEARA